MKNLLAKQFQKLDGDGQILLSHGSRRPLANQKIARLAHELGAIPAYNS